MRVAIGFVLRAHGLKGAVRVRAEGDAILDLDELLIGDKLMKVRHAQRERAEFLIELEGVTTREGAEALRGAAISVERDQLPPLRDDELYVSDLIGCTVFDSQGRPLGEVTAVSSNSAHDLLTVRGEREWLLPFVGAIVTSVDVAARKIVCDPPPGLVNLDEAES